MKLLQNYFLFRNLQKRNSQQPFNLLKTQIFMKIFKTSNHKIPNAFTLIELSAVIVIIGILIAGVVGASGLVKKSRISSAQSLTKASPVNGIQNNDLWLESSLDSSFKETETSTDDAVTTWYDQKNSTNKSSITAVGTGPTYSNTINYIHAVKFSGSTANYLQVTDASFLNKTSYTIFVVEKRQSSSSNNYFIGDSTQTTANQSLLLGYSSDGNVIHSQSGTTLTNASISSVDSYSNYSDKPRVFSFIFDTTSGSKSYINGTLSAQESTNLTPLSNISSLSIGKGYTGEIGEIIAFSRSLKSDERKSVEDYLFKKWSVKTTRDVASNCASGIITENGCKASCPVSVAGVSTTSVADGFSGPLTCSATGYAGGTTTQTYTCANGSLSPTPSSSVCTTSGATSSGATACATNYELVGSVCQAISCSVPSKTGTNTTTVTSASGTVNCDKSGYFGGPASYTCSNGTFTVTANACYANPSCTGGDSTITISGYKIHIFTTVGSSTLTCSITGNAELLVVGGGGSGGASWPGYTGGGGGGGGVIYSSSYPLTSSNSVVVGKGGNAVKNFSIGSYTGTYGNNGDSSSFNSAIATGGGAGGAGYSPYTNGISGGSGGGAGVNNGSGGSSNLNTSQTNITEYYGNSGGSSASPTYGSGASGGGAGGAAVGATPGPGISKSISGSSVTYAAGGVNASSGIRSAAASNTGNGGDGAANGTSGAGGSGIVIVRYVN
jgi:prepilin-type N-terminal cleavage/methylation domain-containing protein